MKTAKVELTRDELQALIDVLNEADEFPGLALDAWRKLELALANLTTTGALRAKKTESK